MRLIQVLSDIHRPIESAESHASNDTDNPEFYEAGLPVVAFRYVFRKYNIEWYALLSKKSSRLSDEYVKENPHVKQEWIQVSVSPTIIGL